MKCLTSFFKKQAGFQDVKSLYVDHQISSWLYSTFVNLRYRDESKWNISITMHSLSFSPSLSLSLSPSLSLSLYIYIHTHPHTHTPTHMYMNVCICMQSCFSCVWLTVTQWTVAHQSPLSTGSSGQEDWSELLCSPPGESSQPRDRTHDSCISCNSRWILYR